MTTTTIISPSDIESTTQYLKARLREGRSEYNVCFPVEETTCWWAWLGNLGFSEYMAVLNSRASEYIRAKVRVIESEWVTHEEANKFWMLHEAIQGAPSPSPEDCF